MTNQNFRHPHDVSSKFPLKLQEKFEFFSYNHALEILNAFTDEWQELQACLENFEVSIGDLINEGGNESNIPKKISQFLYPKGWEETRISGDLHIKFFPRNPNKKGLFIREPIREQILEGYLDGHNIDYLKNRVAFDLEWNSKDQTFDRDIMAMRTYYDCDTISVGIILTRAHELNDIFAKLKDKNGAYILRKYGASTTWMGKLLPRLDSRRNGGCPILAIGIKKACVTDWKE